MRLGGRMPYGSTKRTHYFGVALDQGVDAGIAFHFL